MSEILAEGRSDRDSDLYVQNVLPITEEFLFMGISLSLNAGLTVVLDAPLLRQVRLSLQDGLSLDEWLRVRMSLGRDVEIATYWHGIDERTQRQRMLSRGAERDASKLSNWDGYAEGVRWAYAAVGIHEVVDFVVPHCAE